MGGGGRCRPYSGCQRSVPGREEVVVLFREGDGPKRGASKGQQHLPTASAKYHR